MKKRVVLIIVFLTSVATGISCAQNSQVRAGGPCDYDKIPGTCEIISITKTSESIRQAATTGGPGYEGYVVNFKFKPLQENQEYGAARAGHMTDVLGKEYALQLANSWYPGDKYLGKYRIAQGNIFNCTMSLIRKGACTPVVFEFTDIDAADYFETAK
jgi:Ni/Co efflux regulator RcnB